MRFMSIKITSNTGLTTVTHHHGDALERLGLGGTGSTVGAGSGRIVASDCPLTSLVREKAPLDRLSEDLGYGVLCSSDRRNASFSDMLLGIICLFKAVVKFRVWRRRVEYLFP